MGLISRLWRLKDIGAVAAIALLALWGCDAPLPEPTPGVTLQPTPSGEEPASAGPGVTLQPAPSGEESASAGDGVTLQPAPSGEESASAGDGVTLQPAPSGEEPASAGPSETLQPTPSGEEPASAGPGVTLQPAPSGEESASAGDGVTLQPAPSGEESASAGDGETLQPTPSGEEPASAEAGETLQPTPTPSAWACPTPVLSVDPGTVRVEPGHASLHVTWLPPIGASADSYIVKHRIAGSAEVMKSVTVGPASGVPGRYEGSYKYFHHQITGLTPGVQYEVAVHRVVGEQRFPVAGDLAETSGAEHWKAPWRSPPRTQEEACYPPWFYPKLPHYPEEGTSARLTQWLWDYERSDAKESQRMLTDAEAGNWIGNNDLSAGATGRSLAGHMDSGQLLVYVNLTDEASALAAIEWIVRHGGSGEVWYGPSRPHIDNQPGILGSIPLPLVGELSELPGVIYVEPFPALPSGPLPIYPIVPTPTPEETP